MKRLWGTTAMLAATILWGFTFSVQSKGAELVDAMLFVMLRSIVGSAALAVVIMGIDLLRWKKITLWGTAATAAERKFLLTGGIWCGLFVTLASFCQQFGLKYISAGKTGFLTALYIVIVPLLGILFKRKTSLFLWIAVALAMFGAWLLCGGIGNIGIGEWFVIGCAGLFSLHILVIDHYAAKCDCIRLSCLQFLTASVLACIFSLAGGETWNMIAIQSSLPFWMFCGIGSSAVAFTLQMAAQKYLHPVTATLLMSLESVFAVLGGWLFLSEVLTIRELWGCGVIFLAILLTQIPVRKSVKQ